MAQLVAASIRRRRYLVALRMLSPGNIFDNANNYESIVITNAKICNGITTH